MGEKDSEVVVLATKILARLVVTHGVQYSKKFADKTGGYTVMRHRLKNWWNDQTLWATCLALLLGVDVALLDLEQDFDFSELLRTLISKNETKISFPEIIPVITDMLRAGVETSLQASRRSLVPKKAATSRTGSLLRKEAQSNNSSEPFFFPRKYCIQGSPIRNR